MGGGKLRLMRVSISTNLRCFFVCVCVCLCVFVGEVFCVVVVCFGGGLGVYRGEEMFFGRIG